MVQSLRRGDVLQRIGLCLLSALIMWAVTMAWAPPFSFRTGYVPPRNLVARTTFDVRDLAREEQLERQKRSETICFYQNNVQPLTRLQQDLKVLAWHKRS